MEELTKQQIVLLTLLVSFITSIATGIITVALMDQAPPGVTQTINRVVERTIEKVTPSPVQQAAAVVTKETIVVKEDELVVKAIEKNAKSLVSIVRVTGEGEGKQENFSGNGLIVSKDGLIATDESVVWHILDENQNPIPQSFKIVFSDGTIFSAIATSSENKFGLALLKITQDDKTKNIFFVPATIADVASLKLGQTVITLGGEYVSVATGIVSNISQKSEDSGSIGLATSTAISAKNSTQIIKTDIRNAGKIVGSILVNLSGEVVGIHLSSIEADNAFLSVAVISNAIAKVGAVSPKQ